MRRSVFAWALISFVMSWSSTFAGAQEVGSAAEAKAMIHQVIEALKANENDALATFNDKNNDQFHAHDLYVFCINLADGKFTAQLEPQLIGTDAEELRVNNDAVGQRLLATLREAPEGVVVTVAYKALRPGTTSGPPPSQRCPMSHASATRAVGSGTQIAYHSLRGVYLRRAMTPSAGLNRTGPIAAFAA